jgi:hypothetical protein
MLIFGFSQKGTPTVACSSDQPESLASIDCLHRLFFVVLF